jgi:hypothetical protein
MSSEGFSFELVYKSSNLYLVLALRAGGQRAPKGATLWQSQQAS